MSEENRENGIEWPGLEAGLHLPAHPDRLALTLRLVRHSLLKIQKPLLAADEQRHGDTKRTLEAFASRSPFFFELVKDKARIASEMVMPTEVSNVRSTNASIPTIEASSTSDPDRAAIERAIDRLISSMKPATRQSMIQGLSKLDDAKLWQALWGMFGEEKVRAAVSTSAREIVT